MRAEGETRGETGKDLLHFDERNVRRRRRDVPPERNKPPPNKEDREIKKKGRERGNKFPRLSRSDKLGSVTFTLPHRLSTVLSLRLSSIPPFC